MKAAMAPELASADSALFWVLGDCCNPFGRAGSSSSQMIRHTCHPVCWIPLGDWSCDRPIPWDSAPAVQVSCPGLIKTANHDRQVRGGESSCPRHFGARMSPFSFLNACPSLKIIRLAGLDLSVLSGNVHPVGMRGARIDLARHRHRANDLAMPAAPSCS